MQIISREAWGARAPRSVTKVARDKRRRFDVHHSAGPESQTPRQIQNFHMDNRKWSDVGYNFLVDEHGDVYEGRGWDVLGSHIANHNTAGIGVCYIGNGDKVTAAARRSISALYDMACERFGRKLTPGGHRDHAPTACPGDALYRWVHAGMKVDGDAPQPTPRPPASSRPAPGTPVRFPLPAGHYFGPADGPDRSVSGHYGRMFRGRTDRDWLKRFTDQLSRRGWSIGKGRTYLTRYGNDGKYGPEYERLVKAFQRDQGLTVDGLIGPVTWDAAYRNRVTP